MGLLTSRCLLVLPLLAVLVGSVLAEQDGSKEDAQEKRKVALAIIVHPKNPVTKISFNELRAYFKMERQFWPNKKRCDIYLPARKTAAHEILLAQVYRMSHARLQKYWVRKLFSGDIPAKPSYVPSARAAGSQVLRSQGALSVVTADEVPPKVRVLLIDGKKPGDAGYPLVGEVKREP